MSRKRRPRKLRPRKYRPQTADLENADLENADLANADLANDGFMMLNEVIPKAQTSIAFMFSRVAVVIFRLSKTISGAIYGFLPRLTLDVNL